MASFADNTLPHFDRAYRLARKLTRNEHDAMDVVQEAYLRALRFYRGFRGNDARPWLLAIVRNVFYTSARENGALKTLVAALESAHMDAVESRAERPDVAYFESHRTGIVARALEALPTLYREILMLRVAEDLSYREIAVRLQIPEGTVMSRLARARRCLFDKLQHG